MRPSPMQPPFFVLPTEHSSTPVHQRRPNLVECFERTIVAFESAALGNEDVTQVDDIDAKLRATWCGLYCGGSQKIQNELAKAARKFGVGWQAELFDW